MRVKKYLGHKIKKRLKEFWAKDEDELLDLVSDWVNSDDYNCPFYEKGEWVVPKIARNVRKQ